MIFWLTHHSHPESMRRSIYADRHRDIYPKSTHTYAQMKYKCSISVHNYLIKLKKKKENFHPKFWILYPSSSVEKQKTSCLLSLDLCPCTFFIPFNFLCQKYLQFPDNSVLVSMWPSVLFIWWHRQNWQLLSELSQYHLTHVCAFLFDYFVKIFLHLEGFQESIHFIFIAIIWIWYHITYSKVHLIIIDK